MVRPQYRPMVDKHILFIRWMEPNLHSYKPRDKWSEEDRRRVQYNLKAKNIITSAIGIDEYFRVSNYSNAKEMWDTPTNYILLPTCIAFCLFFTIYRTNFSKIFPSYRSANLDCFMVVLH